MGRRMPARWGKYFVQYDGGVDVLRMHLRVRTVHVLVHQVCTSTPHVFPRSPHGWEIFASGRYIASSLFQQVTWIEERRLEDPFFCLCPWFVALCIPYRYCWVTVPESV